MPRARRAKKKAKHVARRMPVRQMRWFIKDDGQPFSVQCAYGVTRCWLQVDNRCDKTVDNPYHFVDASGRRVHDAQRPSYYGTTVEVHAPGICGDTIVKNKRQWVSQGL